MKRIKVGDTVVVIAGKSKGHVGLVKKIICTKSAKIADYRIIVDGANLIKKHLKGNPRQQQPGQIKTVEASLHISNVALFNPITKKPGKVGFKLIEKDGIKHKVRYFKSNNEIIDVIE
jgi:large subunit ribosomal protein L24